jgi:murein L,D-transpeptidase YafK
MRTHLELLTLAILSALIGFLSLNAARAGDFRDAQRRVPRYREAEARQLEAVRAEFVAAGAAWPPAGLYLRAFKRDGIVELWGRAVRGVRYVPVRRFEICMASGTLGPKVREGDGQVPEGLYEVAAFNPRSRYHLALKVSYPDAADRRRAAALGVPPGGDIMVHGSCVTIGCLPLRDGPMEALYVAAVTARDAGAGTVPVHIHPCRYEDPACQAALRAHPASEALSDHWTRLAAADAQFVATGRPPGAAGL